MISYIAHYLGEESKEIITRSIQMLGGDIRAVIIDQILDGETRKLKDQLEMSIGECRIEMGDGLDHPTLMETTIRFCYKEKIEYRKNKIEHPEIVLEIGNMNTIQAGSIFLAAGEFGAEVVCYDIERRRLQRMEFRERPNVSRIGYTTWKILDVLYDNGILEYDSLKKEIYADSLVGKDDDYIQDFYKTHHHAYKVLEGLCEKKWVSKDGKSYRITPTGNTVRVMLQLKKLEASISAE